MIETITTVNQNLRRVWIACLGIALIGWLAGTQSFAASADGKSSPASLEKSAVELLNDGRYSRAASIFADLAARFPASPGHDSWLYNLARSKYHLGQFENAKRDFADGISRFSGSEYTAYRWFFLGNLAVRESDATGAVGDYTRAYALAEDQRLVELAFESLQSVMTMAEKNGDSLPDFKKLIEATFPAVGARQSAAELVASLGGKPTGSDFGRGSDSFRGGKSKLPTVTLALPFSGKLERYAKRIERGANLANYYSSDDSRPVVYFKVEDTEGATAKAVQIAQRAESDKSLALIGPLTSEEAVAVSAALNCAALPALAPAANQNNFAKLSQTMFQLTPSPQTIGRRLAEYAFLQIPVTTAAALAQNSESDMEMATAFSERFKELGGEIVAFEIFPPGATDFGAFGERIKTRFLGAYDETAILIGENGDTLDFDEAPVEIGCIFVGATVRQLQLILPQINYHNIRTTLIGSDGLATPRVWEMPLQNVKNIIFTSWRTQDSDNSVFRSFAQMYRDRYGESPDRLAALGYDAVRMIIEGLRTGARSSSAMSRYLESMTLHRGASGNVAFGDEHVNRELSLYTVIDKLPKKLTWTPPRAIETD